MDRSAFYNALRDGPLFGSFSQDQVTQIELILDEGQGLPLSHLAYTLATAYGETGGRMTPIQENMNYNASRIPEVFSADRLQGHTPEELANNPELLANVVYGVDWLGNDEWGDGWKYRGHGIVQLTGKANFRKMGDLIGIDLVSEPHRALEPAVAAKALIAGIRDGLYTGKKASDYLPASGGASREQYRQARRIINGTFAASRYADHAEHFEDAIEEGFESRQLFSNDTDGDPEEVSEQLELSWFLHSQPFQESALETLQEGLAGYQGRLDSLGVTKFSAEEVFFLGGNHFNPDSRCYKLNSYPPKSLWKNMDATLLELEALRIELDSAIYINSAFRNKDYNTCIRGASNSLHMQFSAIDFRSETLTPRELARRLRIRRDNGTFKGGIGVYNSFVHIDTRGENRNFKGSDTPWSDFNYVFS